MSVLRMKKMGLARLTVAALWALIPCDLFARKFTDEKGRTIEASIVQVLEDQVELKMDNNGKTYQVPLARLSKSDLEYIKEWDEAKAQEEAGEE